VTRAGARSVAKLPAWAASRREELLEDVDGFVVESPGGRIGLLVDVRTVCSGRTRHVDSIVVSAGGSVSRVLIIPTSEISEVVVGGRRIMLRSSPKITGSETRSRYPLLMASVHPS
jgi:hypothetical protein